MLPLYRYAIEDCPFSQFALNPALFKRFVYYDNLVYHQRMKYHWKEENLIFYSKPLVRFSDHRLLDGNPNPFQDTIMTLHHQGGCIVKSWFQIHFQLPWKPLDPHFQYYWAKKYLTTDLPCVQLFMAWPKSNWHLLQMGGSLVVGTIDKT